MGSGFHPARRGTSRAGRICDAAGPILRSVADAMSLMHVQLGEEFLEEENWRLLDAARSTVEIGLEQLLALAKGRVWSEFFQWGNFLRRLLLAEEFKKSSRAGL